MHWKITSFLFFAWLDYAIRYSHIPTLFSFFMFSLAVRMWLLVLLGKLPCFDDFVKSFLKFQGIIMSLDEKVKQYLFSFHN